MKAVWQGSKTEISPELPQSKPKEAKTASVRDISGRKRADSISTLAAGIAHQFNNALVGIVGNIELLKMDLPEDENIDKYLETMETSVRRMAHLTDQLLAYARGGKYQPKTICLSDFVEHSLPLIQHGMDSAIHLETDLSGGISYIEADPTQIQMVLSAVVTNASEAIDGPGCIRITTRNQWIDEELAKLHPDLRPGYYVCLTIEDDGKGMDEETRSRLFEPFFTTKFQGRGLGMAAVYGIVRHHHGWISVDSEVGRGTVISIYLPASEVELEEAEGAEMEVDKGPGPLLVIEDEGAVMGG